MTSDVMTPICREIENDNNWNLLGQTLEHSNIVVVMLPQKMHARYRAMYIADSTTRRSGMRYFNSLVISWSYICFTLLYDLQNTKT